MFELHIGNARGQYQSPGEFDIFTEFMVKCFDGLYQGIQPNVVELGSNIEVLAIVVRSDFNQIVIRVAGGIEYKKTVK